jgi:toluene monooxygenase system protein D
MQADRAEGYINNWVGPILRSGEVAQAAVEAVQIDNPGKQVRVEDKNAYIRIETDRECVLRRKTMEEILGRPFRMAELEVNLSSFAGQIEMKPDQIRFYFTKSL